MLIKKELVIVKDPIGLAQLEVSIINSIDNTQILLQILILELRNLECMQSGHLTEFMKLTDDKIKRLQISSDPKVMLLSELCLFDRVYLCPLSF